MPLPDSPIFGLPCPADGDDLSIELAVKPLRDRLEVVLNAFLPVGVELWWPGSALPVLPGTTTVEFQWADGALLAGVGVGQAYKPFLDAVGHAYNGGVDPGGNSVRKPDKRGRFALGADNMGVGAAGRLPNTNRLRGQNTLAELITLTAAQIPSHTHRIFAPVQTPQPDDGYPLPRFASGAATGPGYNLTAEGQTGTTDQPHSNIPSNEVDNVIVRVR
jgi:microcystin-dependent protein